MNAPVHAAEPAIEVRRLAKRYGAVTAIEELSFAVPRGSITALLGGNGAGKTTTLAILLGVLLPSSGEARVLGIDILKHRYRVLPRMNFGSPYVELPKRLTVRENLELGAFSHKDGATMSETIDDVVQLFPRIGERMKQQAGTLSGGEQQMLAIGRAMMSRPALLLLDEPSLGIAPKLVQQIFESIDRIAESGTTILLVEQNTRIALRHAARAYVLRTGEIAMSGDAKELAENEEIKKAYLGG